MDAKDVMFDIIDNWMEKILFTDKSLEDLCKQICKALDVCEYCGAKLRGNRNE